MKLQVVDEFSPLKNVAVCWGYSVPEFEDYKTDDPQELKWGEVERWDRAILLKQQDGFFSRLSKYGVELTFLETDTPLWWQMYTRDTGFVLGDCLYYSSTRTLKARNGEVEKLLKTLNLDADKVRALKGKIEGGDVLAGETTFVGISNRTEKTTCDELQQYYPIKPIFLGDDIMHLDCRMTLLPNKHVLAYLGDFSDEDRQFITDNYTVIEVTQDEVKLLGTNVFIVNPETIFVEERSQRIQKLLKDAGFNVESVAYSEPIVLGGSFRCTTLPLVRE